MHGNQRQQFVMMLFQYNNNVLYGGDVSRLSKPIITRYQCAVPKHGVCLWLCFCVRTHNQCKNVSQKSKRTNNKKAKFQYMSVQHITIGTRTMIGCLERHSADVSFFHVCPLLCVCVYKSAESPLQMNTTNEHHKWQIENVDRYKMVSIVDLSVFDGGVLCEDDCVACLRQVSSILASRTPSTGG